MDSMTGVERMTNILARKPVDRIGVYEHFWGDTRTRWEAEGYLSPSESLSDHFGFDMADEAWVFNIVADLDYEIEVIEETEDTILTRDGNGAVLRRPKHHDGTPEHVDFAVKDRTGWEELIKPRLKPERRRIDFEKYRELRAEAKKKDRFFVWSGVNVFESMHPVCGHEHMLVGMALDPDWVRDMVMTYAQLIVDLQEILFAEEGKPDGVCYYEDMGFKFRPFMSPAMYKEIIQPGHILTIDYAKSQGLPVIMHSCGYVEPLIPGMIESGIDCLQAMEVKAGMDLVKFFRDFGDRLSFMGGIDVRELCSNDMDRVNAELEAKVPHVMGNYGYVLHSDHSIPHTVNYETFSWFVERGLQLGTY